MATTTTSRDRDGNRHSNHFLNDGSSTVVGNAAALASTFASTASTAALTGFGCMVHTVVPVWVVVDNSCDRVTIVILHDCRLCAMVMWSMVDNCCRLRWRLLDDLRRSVDNNHLLLFGLLLWLRWIVIGAGVG